MLNGEAVIFKRKAGKIDKKTRSKIMSSIRAGGNKSTEVAFRMGLVGAGVSGWKVRPLEVLGKPDFFFEHERVAVFLDGCFWHGCPKCYRRPQSNQRYWDEKIKRVKKRDKTVNSELASSGVGVFRVWEHEIKECLSNAINRLKSVLNGTT